MTFLRVRHDNKGEEILSFSSSSIECFGSIRCNERTSVFNTLYCSSYKFPLDSTSLSRKRLSEKFQKVGVRFLKSFSSIIGVTIDKDSKRATKSSAVAERSTSHVTCFQCFQESLKLAEQLATAQERLRLGDNTESLMEH